MTEPFISQHFRLFLTNGVLFLGGCGPAMSCVTLVIFTVLRVSTIPKRFPPLRQLLLLPSCRSLTPFWHQLSASLPFLASTSQPSFNFLAFILFSASTFLSILPPYLYLYFSLLFFFDLHSFPAPTFSHRGKRAEPGVIFHRVPFINRTGCEAVKSQGNRKK